jgi:hypothetical protein
MAGARAPGPASMQRVRGPKLKPQIRLSRAGGRKRPRVGAPEARALLSDRGVGNHSVEVTPPRRPSLASVCSGASRAGPPAPIQGKPTERPRRTSGPTPRRVTHRRSPTIVCRRGPPTATIDSSAPSVSIPRHHLPALADQAGPRHRRARARRAPPHPPRDRQST